ncbi:MAG: hypothetical protein PHP48_09370, partial [Bacteroidales bacterium]|nr:hypothetical protein [Bacteroidales bacterium]
MLQQTKSAGDHKNLLKLIKNYKTPSIGSSLWQIANTFLPYVGLWILMIYAMQISYWLVIP